MSSKIVKTIEIGYLSRARKELFSIIKNFLDNNWFFENKYDIKTFENYICVYKNVYKVLHCEIIYINNNEVCCVILYCNKVNRIGFDKINLINYKKNFDFVESDDD